MPACPCAAVRFPSSLLAPISRLVRRPATLLVLGAATLLVGPTLTASAYDTYRVVTEQTMHAPVPGGSYEVEDGDSLYSIAADLDIPNAKLADWVDAFLQLNGMDDPDMLTAGKTVKIPGAASGAGSNSTSPRSASGSAGGSRAYTVQNGDTLYSIGANLNVPDDKLYTWVQDTLALNDMDDSDVLSAGKTIQISTRHVPVPKPITASYTVKAGDTLSDIADKQGVSAAGLSSWTSLVLELNALGSADMLVEGQLLQLPVTTSSSTSTTSSTSSGPSTTSQSVSLQRPATSSTVSYTVKAGDTLEAIGIAQKVPDLQLRGWVEDVRKLNKLNEDAFITEGQKLELPALSVAPPSATSSTAADLTAPASSPPRPPSASSSSSNGTSTTQAGSTSQSGTTPPSNNPILQNAPRSMTGCFYVIKPEDDLVGIARKVGVTPAETNAWIAKVKQLNGVDFKVMPVGTAIQMPC